jgi:membrane protein
MTDSTKRQAGVEGRGTGLAGTEAERPSDIPKRGWLQIVRRAWKEAKADNVPLIAAGVAFFGFLSLFPALIATLTVYGLVVSPEQARKQVDQYASALPSDSRKVLIEQLTAVTQGNQRALGLGLLISVLLALWSASGGMSNLVKAINITYDEDEKRGFVKQRATALLLTVGAMLFMIVTLGLVAVLPAVLDHLPLGPAGRILVEVVRWGALVVAVMVALAVLYRVAPDRDAPRFRWVTPGAIVATVLWVAGSAAFSLYVSNFGKYNKTYGALAGVAVLMLWLYLTSYIVLLGAEINAESEQQTVRDTTKGEPRPLGERGAVKADSLPDSAT